MKKVPRRDHPLLLLSLYDIFVVAFSGGKDSVALVLWLLEQGVPKEKIELHHHLIDGNEGDQFFDWPCTHGYVQAFGKALGIRVYMSWRHGGFRKMITRKNETITPVKWEGKHSSKIQQAGGTRGTPSTTMIYPQVSGDLSVRRCSPILKIDVMGTVLNNDIRYKNKTVLVLSGERGEESPARACYAKTEPDRSDLRNPKRNNTPFRHIDRHRPLRDWTEEQVWAIMERHRIQPHPAYELGFGRCSCAFCIFFSKNQAATARYVLPDQARQVAEYEELFGKTIKRRGSFNEWADAGEVYAGLKPDWVDVARSTEWPAERPIILEHWALPPGAFGESDGPL